MLLDADLITNLIPRWRLKVSKKNVAAERRQTEGLSRFLVLVHSAGLRTGDSGVKTGYQKMGLRVPAWSVIFRYRHMNAL
jgi:hypothetical protein